MNYARLSLRISGINSRSWINSASSRSCWICEVRSVRPRRRADGHLEITTATLEVLARIAFKQPISRAESDRQFASAAGRLRFVITETLLQRFGLASLQELTAAALSGSQFPNSI